MQANPPASEASKEVSNLTARKNQLNYRYWPSHKRPFVTLK